MKNIFLLRHAKALPSTGEADHLRKLSDDGLQDASRLGDVIKRKKYDIDLCYCSSALRTKQTYEKIAEISPAKTIQFIEKIYSASTGDLFQIIQNSHDDHKSIMIVGHNPSIYELAAKLSGEGQVTLLNKLSSGYRPGTLSVIKADIDYWSDIQLGENILFDYCDPKDYNPRLAGPTDWT